MKLGDLLYFAPNVPFLGLDFDSEEIVGIFRKRIEAYYLSPATSLMGDPNAAFAATALLVSTIDALVEHSPAYQKINRHGERYIAWLQNEMGDLFNDESTAKQFYKEIRCGAVHESRIKNGCVFDFEIGQAIFVEDGKMGVNPKYLMERVEKALQEFCDKTLADKTRLTAFQTILKDYFKVEMNQPPGGGKPSGRG